MYRGDYAAGATVELNWNTIAIGVGSVTRATNGTIAIYKNGSATQRTSANGITDTEDFDSQTGVHHLTIDLSDNTDAGFYAAGNDYSVQIQGMVVDGVTINAVIAEFSIENRHITTAAEVRAEMDSNSTQLAAIVADTNELQTDWASGGRLDLILDARASQTSVDDLPTNAELTTALAGADDAVLTAIGNLNDLSAAEVNAEVDTALADYDGPTRAEATADKEEILAEIPDSAPTANENADALLDRADAIEDDITVRGALRAVLAVTAGETSGAGSSTNVFKDAGTGATDRVTSTFDSNSNRVSVTLDLG